MVELSTLLSGIVIMATVVAAVLGIVIWIKPSDHQLANRYLSLCLFFSAFTYCLYGIFYLIEDFALNYKLLFFIPLVTELLIVPPCYLYVRGIYQMQDKSVSKYAGLHAVPAILALGVLLPVMMGAEDAQYRLIKGWFSGDYITGVIEIASYEFISVAIVSTILVMQLMVYLFLIIKHQKMYRMNIESAFSDIEQIRLQWVWGIIIFWSFYLLVYLACWLYPPVLDTTTFYGFLLMDVAFYLYVAIQALLHPILFTSRQRVELEALTEKSVGASQKYVRSSITDKQAESIKQQLLQYMASEKPYLDTTLTISQLAQQLGLPRSSHLSQVLSGHIGENFYQFVNRHRVEEAKHLLLAMPNKAILDIALKAGFNSVSTFYHHFKNIVGETPADFQARYKTGVK